MKRTRDFINKHVALFPNATAVLLAQTSTGCQIYVPVGDVGDEQLLAQLKMDLQDRIDNDEKDNTPPPDDPDGSNPSAAVA